MEIAIIGDIHKAWNEVDLRHFAESSYDLVLFVGDLPGRTHRGTNEVARNIAKIEKPALFLPGNHDGVSVMQLLAEIQNSPEQIEKRSVKQDRLCEELEEALRPIPMCGYSHHPFETDDVKADIIAARPHSMGGPGLAYAPYLRKRFQVSTIEESSALICKRVDESRSKQIIFLAHNGPTGLGERRDSIWGCDFRKNGGDFGDPDLRVAIDHARKVGKDVLAVVAGHMHLAVKGGGTRPWLIEKEGTLFINAARVPRIFREDGQTLHHHVRLHLTPSGATAEQIHWPEER